MKSINICICGHPLKAHYLTGDGCDACYYESKPQDKWQHRFQLDNLTLIEKLAKAKGLI